jgi:putative methyltransferase (TIGR04325 family)
MAWPQQARSWIEPLLAAHESQGAMPSDNAHRTFLAVAALLTRLRGSLRVVDFGGGLGEPYLFLVDTISDTSIIDYRVVELPQVCEEGRRVLQKYPGIRFQSSLPPAAFAPEIVYANGTLQLTPDYRETIDRLTLYKAPFMLFAELPAGNIPTFASAQTNVFGQVPVWFFNLNEIVESVCRRGYRVVLDAQFEIGREQTNFPPGHRLPNYHTLLFCREDWFRGVQNALRAIEGTPKRDM